VSVQLLFAASGEERHQWWVGGVRIGLCAAERNDERGSRLHQIHPPNCYLGPNFAAKAGMDALALILARELALWPSRPRSWYQAPP
jgi:hypothetical protein